MRSGTLARSDINKQAEQIAALCSILKMFKNYIKI